MFRSDLNIGSKLLADITGDQQWRSNISWRWIKCGRPDEETQEYIGPESNWSFLKINLHYVHINILFNKFERDPCSSGNSKSHITLSLYTSSSDAFVSSVEKCRKNFLKFKFLNFHLPSVFNVVLNSLSSNMHYSNIQVCPPLVWHTFWHVLCDTPFVKCNATCIVWLEAFLLPRFTKITKTNVTSHS